MGELRVQRWHRYGKDRLYVDDEAGVRVGWHDLLNGEDHVEAPDREAEFVALVAGWLAGAEAGHTGAPTRVASQSPAAHAPEPAVAAPAPVVPRPADPPAPEQRWDDLAGRQAGAKSRERAIELRHEAPVRTFVARVLGVHTDERAWRIGADGEEKVAARLASLAAKDPRWRHLNAIPVGAKGADIDHLVIGPGGVFSLNAKHHPGARIWVRGNAFRVNGAQQPYVRNSRHEAARAGRLLTATCGFQVTVTGVVVPVGASEVTVAQQPADVHVVNRRALTAWLREQQEVLDQATVAAIFEMARRSTTWRT